MGVGITDIYLQHSGMFQDPPPFGSGFSQWLKPWSPLTRNKSSCFLQGPPMEWDLNPPSSLGPAISFPKTTSLAPGLFYKTPSPQPSTDGLFPSRGRTKQNGGITEIFRKIKRFFQAHSTNVFLRNQGLALLGSKHWSPSG